MSIGSEKAIQTLSQEQAHSDPTFALVQQRWRQSTKEFNVIKQRLTQAQEQVANLERQLLLTSGTIAEQVSLATSLLEKLENS